MARKGLVVAAILGLLASPDSAWAVLSSTSVVLTDHGQAIPGATITLSRPHHRRARAVAANPSAPQPQGQPAPQPVIAASPAQAPPAPVLPDQTWLTAKSDPTGHVRLQFDDQDTVPGAEFDIVITYPNGMTARRFNVPVEMMRTGGAWEVTQIGTATPEPAGATTASTAPPPDLGFIPAPPVQMLGSSAHQAQQDLNDPERAYDPATGQALIFDRNRRSWIDPASGQPIGFAGALAADGIMIPAPPVVTAKSGSKHQAQQDKGNPERAYDPVTGESLIWDRARSTWIDTKTQKVVGFQGIYVGGSGGPGPGPFPVDDMSGSSSPAAGFGFGFGSAGKSGGQDQSDKMLQEQKIKPKQ